MEKNYNPKEFEARIYKMWNEKKHFHAEPNPNKEPFCIVIPPPNITSHLHEGHALNCTLQDIIIRTKRMQGFETLWLPGTDHASIATEVKVLEKIKNETGKTKTDLTREEFLEEAWQWKDKYEGTILSQLKQLGASCDWDRLRFTLDEGCSKAVTEVFVRLYEEGNIYRGNRMINWCPDCKTSLSDAEVEYELSEGNFYSVKYEVEGLDSIIIATTRPETILGDTAIAVHPEDSRYQEYIGKKAIVPIVKREIPIIADDYVERELGTGALKVTPSHDPNDYEIGKRHNLEFINIFNEDATLNENGKPFEGLDRYEARKAVVARLEEEGVLVEIKKHDHNVGECYRCHHQIEPRISDQWFVQMDDMAKMAIESVQNQEMSFVPARYEKIYMHWLENIRDWNISRQLWWGHQIPAWYCKDCNHITVAREEPTECEACHSTRLERDPDVLDTWFSSALWPFSTLGWPEKTPELDYFYPTNVLVTGYDIIFFWVARMMFSGLKQMGEAPFRYTLINGLVRDSQGRKISKSLGNGVDPVKIIEEYGADALRFMLISGTSAGSDSRFLMDNLEHARNFANKLWNASRFILMSIEDKEYSFDVNHLDLAQQWILSERDKTVEKVTRLIEEMELGIAADEILSFTWNKYCDWFIELSKHKLYGDDQKEKDQAIAVLQSVLRDILKLLHPFMPYITEEIWQNLPKNTADLIVSQWPVTQGYTLETKLMESIMEAISKIRTLRQEMDIPIKQRGNIYIQGEKELCDELVLASAYFSSLASVDSLIITQEDIPNASTILVGDFKIFFPFDEYIDYEKEYKRLSEQRKKLESEIARAKGKLSNEQFVQKAPAKLVEAEEQKLEQFTKNLQEIDEKIMGVKQKI